MINKNVAQSQVKDGDLIWVEVDDWDFVLENTEVLNFKSQNSALDVNCFEMFDHLPLVKREPTHESLELKGKDI